MRETDFTELSATDSQASENCRDSVVPDTGSGLTFSRCLRTDTSDSSASIKKQLLRFSASNMRSWIGLDFLFFLSAPGKRP